MKTAINNRKIILASGSPRRRQLMEEAGFLIDTVSLDVDESFSNDIPLHEVAEYLANKKGDHAGFLIQTDEIVITADSVVVLNDRIFNKPTDFKDAYRMLAFLSGKKHYVYTGVCILDRQKRISFTGTSSVYMRDLTDAEIRWYIENYKPFDKAGSYAIQEWIGLCKISGIEGTHANIMGLPTDLVYEGLKNFEGALISK